MNESTRVEYLSCGFIQLASLCCAKLEPLAAPEKQVAAWRLRMTEMKRGMVVRSLAGHDKTQLFIIISVEGEYVYLADGKCKTIDHLKKKKKKHVQPTNYIDESILNSERIDNSKIRKLLKSVAAKQELKA